MRKPTLEFPDEPQHNNHCLGPGRRSDSSEAFLFWKLNFIVTMEATDAMGAGKSWITLEPSGGGTAVTLVNWFESMPAGSFAPLTDSLKGRFSRDIGPFFRGV
jgi:hypothetical protein